MCCFWFTKKQTHSQKPKPNTQQRPVVSTTTFAPFFHDFH